MTRKLEINITETLKFKNYIQSFYDNSTEAIIVCHSTLETHENKGCMEIYIEDIYDSNKYTVLNFNGTNFTTYRYLKTKEYVINLPSLIKIIGVADNNKSITFYIDENELHILKIKIHNGQKYVIFSLKLTEKNHNFDY